MKRRIFIKNFSSFGASLTIIPSIAVSGLGHIAPSDRLNIAGLGIGGKGKVNLKNIVDQNREIIALITTIALWSKCAVNDHLLHSSFFCSI